LNLIPYKEQWKEGTTEGEIIEVLQSGVNILGKIGRLGKSKVFTFNNSRIGKYYEEKKVDVYYITGVS
jgi:hypothetical protein